MRGTGRAAFASVLLLLVGFINIIYGFGALDDANIFANDKRYILDNLNTLGWVLIILGVVQLAGGFSLMAGNTFGRVLGIVGGSLGAIGALLSIGGAYPWNGRMGSSHPGAFNAAFADGSVRPIRYSIKPAVFTYLGNVNDGKVINPDDV